MPRTSANPKGDTFSFRLEPALKVELTRAASEASMPPAQLVRALVRAHLAGRARRDFEAEARRQAQSIAQRALDPSTDEARVMAEIEADLDAGVFADTWMA